jgi:hypothetical protein
MYTFKKPKNSKEAYNLVKDLDVQPIWDIIDNQKMFDHYKNITFIYKDGVLITSGAIAPSSNRLMVIDLNNIEITHKLSVKELNEINLGVRQLEMDF